MALQTKNSLYRKTQVKKENAVDIDQQMTKLEEDIRKLKIDFDIYFNGATKRPPLEARARLEAQLKRIMGNRGRSFAQRYFRNALTAKYTSYRELWRRTLKARGEELI